MKMRPFCVWSSCAGPTAWPGTDNLPITQEAPYTYTLDQTSSLQKNRFATYVKSLSDAKTQLGTYLLKHPEALGDQEKPPRFSRQAEVSDADQGQGPG